MAESICICDEQRDECDRQCAGSLAQQQECEQTGHLTAIRSPTYPVELPDPNFCYRCGHRPAGRVA